LVNRQNAEVIADSYLARHASGIILRFQVAVRFETTHMSPVGAVVVLL